MWQVLAIWHQWRYAVWSAEASAMEVMVEATKHLIGERSPSLVRYHARRSYALALKGYHEWRVQHFHHFFEARMRKPLTDAEIADACKRHYF